MATTKNKSKSKSKARKTSGKMVFEMETDKEGTNYVRYSDGDGHNLYLKRQEMDADFGEHPEAITVTVTTGAVVDGEDSDD